MFNNSFHIPDLIVTVNLQPAAEKVRVILRNMNVWTFINSGTHSVASAMNMNYRIASKWQNDILLRGKFHFYKYTFSLLFQIKTKSFLSNQYICWFYYFGFDRLYDKTWPILLQKLHLAESTLEKHLIKFFHWDKPTFYNK